MFEKGLQAVELLFFAVIVLAAGAVILIIFPPLKSEGPATWLQAIGALGAVAIALLIFKRQISRDERLKWDEKLQKLQAILFIAQDSLGAVKTIYRRLQEPTMADSIEQSETVALQTANSRLESIPLYECPSAATISAIIRLQSEIKAVTYFLAENSRISVAVKVAIVDTLNGHIQEGEKCIDAIKESVRLARGNLIETVV